MYKNINVEAEHNELILENSNGDKVIIPANKRNWVKQKLSEGCHGCIDSLVETLPVASQYAQDGSVYPPNKKVKVNQNNQIKEYDISSPEYKDLYNSGKLTSYDKNSDTYTATPLKEVTITAEAPQWLKDKRQFEKEYTKDKFIDESMPKFSRSMGISSTNMNPNNIAEYNKRINDKVVENIFKRKPTFDNDYSNDRLKTLQGFSQKELELIKNSKYASKIEPSIWSKFEQGLLSVGNMGSPVQFKNQSLSQEEAKKEDNPLNILQPLNIPSKMVQSAYKDNYSFTDALKGKQNNANIVEDIVTDPLNLVGVGLVGKLSKADKVIDAAKAVDKISDISKPTNILKFDDLKNENEFFRIIVGDEAFDDIIKTGQIRVQRPSSYKIEPGVINLDRRGTTPSPSFSKGTPSIEYAKGNPEHYIIRTSEPLKPSTMGAHGKGSTMFPTDEAGKHLKSLDASKTQVYKHIGNGEYELVDVTKAGSKVLNKTDDVVKNLPKLEQIPLDFKIEDVLKNISSTERKNMEIIKKGNAYFRELDNPESLKRLKGFEDEYGIDLLDAYKKAENRWDYGKNIGEHSKFKVKKTDEGWYGLSTTDVDYKDQIRIFDLENKFGKDSKQVKDFYKQLSQEKSINYISDVVPLDRYEKTIWHELSHDINKSIIDSSPKLQEDIKNIFIEKGTADLNKVKKGREYVAKDFYTKKDEVLKDLDNPEKIKKIADDEFDYITRPTETWAFLSTNLRQDLKNTGVIKNYNEILTPEKLEKAIKNGNTVFSRFEPYIKDKDAFIKLFNKMTLSIAPAALYLQSQQNKSEQ